MLRVEIHESANSVSLKLEGRFTGDDAESTRTLIRRCEGMRLVIDLTDVTFIDYVGEEVLAFLARFGGAEFAASTSYTLDVCERLHLRLARDGASDTSASGVSRTNVSRRRANPRQSKNEKL